MIPPEQRPPPKRRKTLAFRARFAWRSLQARATGQTRFVRDGRPYRFRIDDVRDAIQRALIAGDFYERPELELIARWMPAGATVLDVGANIGNHTVAFAALTGAARVIPVEPNPRAIAVLRETLALNGVEADLSLLGFGLGSRPGTAGVQVEDRHNLGGAMLAQGAGDIPIVRGDDAVRDRVDFIKIDAEGMELDVLQGLERVLREHRPVLFVEILNAQVEAVDAWLAGRGYRVAEVFRRYEANVNRLYVASPAA